MKTQSDKSKTSNAYGTVLETPIPFSWEWEEYENHDEVVAAKDELSKDETVKYRNTQRKNNARSKALVAALKAAGYEKPTIENDEQFRLKEMFKVIMSGKKHTEEAARELASATLGIAWEDESE